MAYSLDEIRADVRLELKDTDSQSYNWTDDELNQFIEDTLIDISFSVPWERVSHLGIKDDSVELDITPLSPRHRIIHIEFPSDSVPRQFCHFNLWGNTAVLDLSQKQSVSETALSGTVSFTNGSKTVTGSGTDFDTELEVGDYIRKSSDEIWYQVASIESATQLTLEVAYEGTTGDDTNTVARGKNYIATVYWHGIYTLGSSGSLPDKLKSLVVMGAVVKAYYNWLATIPQRLFNAQSQLTTAETTIGNATNRISQAITDISSLRTELSSGLTDAGNAIGNVSARIDQAVTDLSTGRDLINQVNIGDNVAQNYVRYAAGELEAGESHLNTASTYLEKSETASEYLDAAIVELRSGQTYLEQASGYISLARENIDMAAITTSWGQLATTWEQRFRNQLQKLEKIRLYY